MRPTAKTGRSAFSPSALLGFTLVSVAVLEDVAEATIARSCPQQQRPETMFFMIRLWVILLIIALRLQSCRPLQLTAGQRIEPRSGRKIDASKSVFNLPAIEKWAESRGLKEHHLKTLYKTIMTSSQDDNLHWLLLENSFPKRHAADLTKEFQLCTSRLAKIHSSASGGKKLLIELQTGDKIETVIIRHETSRGVRFTVCVSSQVGCR